MLAHGNIAVKGGRGPVPERQATGCTIEAKTRQVPADGQGRPSPIDHDRAAGRVTDVQVFGQRPVGSVGDVESRAVDDVVVAGEVELGVRRCGQRGAGGEVEAVDDGYSRCFDAVDRAADDEDVAARVEHAARGTVGVEVERTAAVDRGQAGAGVEDALVGEDQA